VQFEQGLTELVLVRSHIRRSIGEKVYALTRRILLSPLCKMELRGAIRGGRFVTGVGGEQFTFPETVDALRQFGENLMKTRVDTTAFQRSLR